MEELSAVENVFLAVAWASVAGIAILAVIWFIRAFRPEDEGQSDLKSSSFPPTETPITLLSPERRYELWRKELTAWTDEDGTQVGLDALLERWRGVPHEKPAAAAPGWGAGNVRPYPPLPVDGRTAAVDPRTDGGDGARMRFFERNRKQMASLAPYTLSALEAKAAAFEEKWGEKWGGAENVGRRCSMPIPFKVGQWVRFTADDACMPGRLARVKGPGLWGSTSVCVSENQHEDMAVGPFFLEPARPRKGEWWMIRKACEPNIVGRTENLGPFQANSDWPSEPCGCVLEAVNFGRGEEAKG